MNSSPKQTNADRAGDVFSAVDFALPNGAGRLAAARACGRACGNAWYDADQGRTPPAYRYPPAVADWHHNLQTAWFEAYLEAWVRATDPQEARIEPVDGLLKRLPTQVDPNAAPTYIALHNDRRELAGMRALDNGWLRIMREALLEWRDQLLDEDNDAFRPKTRAALLGDLKTWFRFCQIHGHTPLPAEHDALEAFVWAMAHPETGLGKKKTTVMRYLATIGRLHRVVTLPNPTTTERMRAVIGRLDHVYRRINEAAAQASAPAPYVTEPAPGLTDDWLDALTPLYGDSLRDKRDLAVLWVAKSTLCRISELAALTVEQLTRNADGTAQVRLLYTKSNQTGELEYRFVSAEARGYLEAWLEAANITDGALFRGLRGGNGQNKVKDTALTPRTLQNIFARANDKLEALSPIGFAPFSGHSARVGAAEDMAAANIGGPAIQLAGGWKSPTMPARYARKSDVKNAGAAQLAALRAAQQKDEAI